MVVTVLLVAAVGQWLFFSARYAIRRDCEKFFLVSTGVMALLWLLLVPQQRTIAPADGAAAPVLVSWRTGGCFAINPGMSEKEVRATFAATPAVVSEEDTQGPGATALVYTGERCVVHVLNGRVRAVRF